ncbi:hypothetical protein NCG89_00620 [Spongiibacter taiwanensis]|uniref:hypothetical protein n=1 Tax=Spongiibacter taiwanensis TaxID=1748242 RepID=UPI0020361DB8|nr:hypothetical protein [Spongiibacter taiwanensis]USA43306.1 hypothetical protein NCG89_00620 [Spongiibacter taiwanensis]
MSFNREQRAAHYVVCGPHASLVIHSRQRQVQFGANFLSQLPSAILTHVGDDQRCGLGNSEMQYFMSLAQRDPLE